ncbi:MAG: hypothetical protein E6I91_12840 [Chloroflexi bacterium]|nr:MAG: hypothetical protein E6I91_12840 [Chloroflexota bacterium]
MSAHDAVDARTRKEGGILDTAPPTVIIQIQPSPSPAMPLWMGEVAAFAHVLTHMCSCVWTVCMATRLPSWMCSRLLWAYLPEVVPTTCWIWTS